MIKAKKATHETVLYRGKRYTLETTFTTPEQAKKQAVVARKYFRGAVAVDRGAEAGKWRYAIFAR